ncbi:hypothetical protein [Flagellimonas sp.]|uniref:hypothetical protein n=1 Tax=Flagellimonas sp. TaxID=2058762 RepID=UPI003BB01D35
MRILTYLSCCVAVILLIACSGGSSTKDITQSPYYWPPMEIDTTKLLSQKFFSEIHKNNLGRYVFAHETIDREWEDEGKFVTTYDMSKMDKEPLFCRLFINYNVGPAEIFKRFSVNPGIPRNAHLRYDYFIDSLQADYYYNYKTSKEERGWESVRYPVFEPSVFPKEEGENPTISIQQARICEALLKHQGYIKSKKDNSVLLGLRYSLADGSSGGGWMHKKTLPLAEKQILLTNVDEGLEWISKIPNYKVPEPFERDKKLEKEALTLMQNHARNSGWKEKFRKAIKTSDYRIKRNKFSGVIEGRTITFALIAEWPDGSWTSQYFNTYQVHEGGNDFGGLSYHGTGDQHLIWGGAVDL